MVLKNIIVLFVSKFRIRFKVLIRIVGLGFDNSRKSCFVLIIFIIWIFIDKLVWKVMFYI